MAASKSEPNWAKAATSRYWAKKSFKEPATCFIAYTRVSLSRERRREAYLELGGGTDAGDR